MGDRKEPGTLTSQAGELLDKARQKDAQTSFFFVTTFKRYQVQMKILADLEKAIAEDGMTVTKEYVKGRRNVYTNPAINEYNRTATAANQTVVTLMKIIDQAPPAQDNERTLADVMRELVADG